MTKEKKFKASVRELAASRGISYQAAHNLMPRKFYRARLVVAAHDGLVIEMDRVVNLSSFPKTGEFVRLNDGRRFQVWHPILKAHRKPESVDADLPSICVHPAPGGQASVAEVLTPGDRVGPVLMELHPDADPRGVRRYVTRPYAEGDGIDIELPYEFGTRMCGHHVYKAPSGLYLKREMLDVEYTPHRIRLPTHPKSEEGPGAAPPL